MPTSTIKPNTVTELLSHLVRMPTLSSDAATNRAALDWVEEKLKGLPLFIKRYEHNSAPSLIATTRRTRSPRLWLAGHMDVVPGRPEQFEPVIKGDKFIGRGAYDMKFAIAAYIQVLQQLGSSLAEYDLGLILTCDEEAGGQDGVRWLLDKQGYRGDLVLLPDGGRDWLLESGAKGLIYWKFTATGTPAHGSRAWEGHNALWRLTDFLNLLREHFPTEPCIDPLHQHNTMNLGRLSGGKVVNQVADYAEAEAEMRMMPDTTPADLITLVKETSLKIPGISVEYSFADASYTQPLDGPAAIWREISEKVTGLDLTDTIFANGGSDARHFARYGIPSIITYPRGGDIHGPNEWVQLSDLDRFVNITSQFVDAWAKR